MSVPSHGHPRWPHLGLIRGNSLKIYTWSYEKYLRLRQHCRLPSSISCKNTARVLQSVNSGASTRNCHWRNWQRKSVRIFPRSILRATHRCPRRRGRWRWYSSIRELQKVLYESTARRIIGTLRSTVMEGSFGNQKQHYNVGRIAARNSRSETLLLFFGIQCANAAILAARQLAIEEKRKQRKRRRASNTIENFELHQSVGDFSLCPNQPKNEFSPAENWKFKQSIYVEQKNHILRHFSQWKFLLLTEYPYL